MNIFWWFFPLVVMLLLLVIKVPVAYAIIFPSLIYFMFGQEYAPAEMMVQKMVTTTETFTYLAVPFFIFASVVFNYAGITRRLMDLANLVVGHLKGGLAHVNILLSMMMGGCPVLLWPTRPRTANCWCLRWSVWATARDFPPWLRRPLPPLLLLFLPESF